MIKKSSAHCGFLYLRLDYIFMIKSSKISDYVDVSIKIKKHGIKKLKDHPAHNASFLTPENIRWFNYVIMNWLPPESKPLVLLPCARANKTRTEKDSRKFISQSMSHQFMSRITRNEAYCRVILSEPLTIIPYSLEGHKIRPDYNLPPDYLSIQSEFIFMRQLALILSKIHTSQPKRKNIYYIGGSHHYFVLHYANKMIGSPLNIIFKIPARGIRDFSSASKEFNQTIIDCETIGIISPQKEIKLTEYLKKRGRYTNKAFWECILVLQENKSSKIDICNKGARNKGFRELYSQISE